MYLVPSQITLILHNEHVKKVIISLIYKKKQDKTIL